MTTTVAKPRKRKKHSICSKKDRVLLYTSGEEKPTVFVQGEFHLLRWFVDVDDDDITSVIDAALSYQPPAEEVDAGRGGPSA